MQSKRLSHQHHEDEMSDDNNAFTLGQGPCMLQRIKPASFVITGDGEYKLRINADGTIDIGPGLAPDEAGRQAIDAMRYQLKWIIDAARSAALEEAAKVADTLGKEESNPDDVGPYGRWKAQDIAAAIRKLKT